VTGKSVSLFSHQNSGTDLAIQQLLVKVEVGKEEEKSPEGKNPKQKRQ
jgi:hypothetical protein